MTSPYVNNHVRGNPYRIRDPRASSLTEIWLVSAVVTILVIRLYLHLTGYPQVGGDTYHIAHMLWGGLGMTIGFGMVMLFAHQVWKPIAALVGGIGFGTFIDELGKFVTQDNDYFFKPTPALIYGVFIVLFVLARYFNNKRAPTEADHLFLASQGIQWQAIGKLDKRRQETALMHLDHSGNTSPLCDQMRDLLENAEIVEDSEQSRILEWREKAMDFYWGIVGNTWMRRVIVGFFMIRVFQILGALVLGIYSGTFDVADGFAFSEWAALATGSASGGFAVYGVVRYFQRHRISALQALATSALISLLFGQFFAFVAVQFAALVGLILDLFVLGTLRLALTAEEERYEKEGESDEMENPREGLGQFL